MAITLAAFLEPLPLTRRPTRQDLMHPYRAKNLWHWVMGFVHAWRELPMHGVCEPFHHGLARIMMAPNHLQARLLDEHDERFWPSRSEAKK
jgi:hypothetical protein